MPTLQQYIQRFAQELGPVVNPRVAGTSTTTLLVDTAQPIRSDIAQGDLYEGWFIWRPAAVAAGDVLRTVKVYDPQNGTLTPDVAWTNAPTGETYELHGLFDPSIVVPRLLNRALKRCMIPTEFSFTPSNALYTRHDVSSVNTWLAQANWVRSVGVLNSAQTDRNIYKPYPVQGRAYQVDSTIYVECGPFNTTDTVFVRAIKPAFNECITPGLPPVATSGGLLAITDTCLAELGWVVYGAMIEAWDDYAHLLEPMASAKVIRTQSEYAALFTQKTNENFDLPPAEFTQPLIHWGPQRFGLGGSW